MKWLTNINTKLIKKDVPEVEEYKLKDKETVKLSESFISRDEKYIASLGNGYIMNYLANKSVKKGFAFITDKRVYFKGSCLSGTGKNLIKTNEEKTVDINNITGSGFTYHRYWGLLVALFISIMVTLAGAFFSAFSSWNFIRSSVNTINKDLNHANKIFTLLDDADKVSFFCNEYSGDYTDDYYRVLMNYYNDHDHYDYDYYYVIQAEKEDEYVVFISVGIVKMSFFDRLDNRFPKAELTIRCIAGELEEYNRLSLTLNNNYLYKLKKCQTQEEIIKFFSKSKIISGNISEIVLSGFASIVPFLLLVELTIIGCIYFKKYLLSRKTLFRIEYAGGCIAFNVSYYAKAEIDDFQRQLRRAKDITDESTTVKAITVETPIDITAQNNVADDLRKYAELLKDGLITQEEYDSMKKKVLGL